ncbi:hypothetical protein M413DRAFT_230670 [Hebeloma cylindrosporum]|uniref:Uncharacterized protein n=1 Tax=Hebeloma cylindrosporum TaxID=76867 RepID=A0A0C3CW71_HEBCY|nr:hypothetical protein M413DRAFT_230670 [Hebeloma cylindrosporum h7]
MNRSGSGSLHSTTFRLCDFSKVFFVKNHWNARHFSRINPCYIIRCCELNWSLLGGTFLSDPRGLAERVSVRLGGNTLRHRLGFSSFLDSAAPHSIAPFCSCDMVEYGRKVFWIRRPIAIRLGLFVVVFQLGNAPEHKGSCHTCYISHSHADDLSPFGVCKGKKKTEAVQSGALARYPSLSKDFLMFIQLSKSRGEPHALLREGKEPTVRVASSREDGYIIDG